MTDPAKKILFPSQDSDEHVFLLIRKHWFNYVIFGFLAFLALIPVSLVAAYWYYNAATISPDTELGIILGLSAFLLFILGVELYGFVDYYLDVDIVTDKRIVDISQNGLFKREISELNLHQIQDVKAKVESMFGTILHFGNVYIQTAGERANFVFDSVPHPYALSKKIIDLYERTNHRVASVPRTNSGLANGVPSSPSKDPVSEDGSVNFK